MNPHSTAEHLWILKGIKPDTRRTFLQAGKTVSCPKGHLCLREREKDPNIFFILDGKVQIYTLTKCGKKKILYILGQDNIANDSFLYDSNTIYCETMDLCHFYLVPRQILLALMEKDLQLMKSLFAYQEKKLARLERQLKNTVGSIYLERRLASKLWKLARDFGQPTNKGVLIDMDLTITFLSDLLGAPRETTSRVCKKLVGQGLIVIEKKKILITDMERMASFHKKDL